MAEAFTFELVSPEALVLSEEVAQVTVPGTEGYFTVLANHAPLMTTVKPGVVEVQLAEGSRKQVFVRGGFADISPSGLTLLAEEATDIADMNMADLDSQIQDAKEDVADADTPEKKASAMAALAELEDAKIAISGLSGSAH